MLRIPRAHAEDPLSAALPGAAQRDGETVARDPFVEVEGAAAVARDQRGPAARRPPSLSLGCQRVQELHWNSHQLLPFTQQVAARFRPLERGAGEESGVDGVDGHVDAFALSVPFRHRGGGRLRVREVARHRFLTALRNPDLENLAGPMEGGQRLLDLCGGVRGAHGHLLTSNAERADPRYSDR